MNKSMVGPGYRSQQSLPHLSPGAKVTLRGSCGGYRGGLPGVVVDLLDDATTGDALVFVPMLDRTLPFFRHELRKAAS